MTGASSRPDDARAGRRCARSAPDTDRGLQTIDLAMTSITDGRTHTITVAEVDTGVRQGQGRYRAVCGAEIMPVAMASPLGPDCPHCPPISTSPPNPAGWIARLFAALTT